MVFRYRWMLKMKVSGSELTLTRDFVPPIEMQNESEDICDGWARKQGGEFYHEVRVKYTGMVWECSLWKCIDL